MSKESRNRIRIELAVVRTLETVYARIPNANCKGLCWQKCTAIVPADAEMWNMERADPSLKGYRWRTEMARALRDSATSYPCPALKDKRCSIYGARPVICRLYGSVDDRLLICEHGCEPTPAPLTNPEARAILAAVKAIEPPAI